MISFACGEKIRKLKGKNQNAEERGMAFAQADVSNCASVFGCLERFDNQQVLWYSPGSLKAP
jgi:hypothetical protein